MPVSFEDIVFIINIGENIEDVYSNLYVEAATEPFTYLAVEQEDGSVIFYRVLVYINCDSKNTHLYSKDGKLYGRENGNLYRGFAYEDDVKNE